MSEGGHPAMNQQYEYKVVRVPASAETIGTSRQKPSGSEAYEQVIHDHAADGWRLCDTWSPPGVAAVWIDLIFERPYSSNQ